MRLSYDVDLPTGSGPVRVHFEDVIERDASGVIVNRAIVSKLGVPIGDVDLVFRAQAVEVMVTQPSS